MLGLAHAALRLAIERRYIVSGEHRSQVQQRIAEFMATKEGGAPPGDASPEAGGPVNPKLYAPNPKPSTPTPKILNQKP